MFGRHQDIAPSVYLLADHLDAILASGEDLLGAQLPLPPLSGHIDAVVLNRRAAALSAFVAQLHRHELAIATHLRQARLRAADVARADKRFASLIRLFLGGTAESADALALLTSSKGPVVSGADDALAFLRSRAVIAPDAAALQQTGELRATDDFCIGASIPLGHLLDLASAFLTSLDVAYGLYPDKAIDDAAAKPDDGGKVETGSAAASDDAAPERHAVVSLRDALAAMSDQN